MSKKIKPINSKLFLCPSILSNKSRTKEKNISYKTSKNKLRPKLNLKKSFSLNYITNPNNNPSKTIQIINAINLTQYNNINQEPKCFYNMIDNEDLNIKNRQINKEIKKIKKILINVNEQNKKKEEEINKQTDLIDEILNINKKAYLDTLENLEKNYKKDKNKNFNDLLDKLYRQYQELMIDNNEKDLEIKKLKKNKENTKRNELIIENNILKNQYNIYKNICKNIEIQNERYQKKIKNKLEIENEILEKNFEILQLQENLKLSHAINIQKEKEKAQLLNQIKEIQLKNKEMKTKIKQINQEYNYILLSKKELEDNIYMAYNNYNNNEINNESNYYIDDNNNALDKNNNNKEDSLSSNINSNNISNIININNNNNNKESINNISNTLEETVNIKDTNIKNNKIEEDNNLNTVDEEKITNIESETNFKKEHLKEKENVENKKINDINDLSIKDDNNKYNESYIEQNEILSEDNEKK